MEKENCCCFGKLNTAKAFIAGLIATIVMSSVMALMGIDSMKALGVMLVGAESTPMQYLAGGLLQFVVGILFAFIYAAWFAPMKLHVLIKGILFGTILTVVAFYGMPVMAKMVNNFKGSTQGMGASGQNYMGHQESMPPRMQDTTVMNPCSNKAMNAYNAGPQMSPKPMHSGPIQNKTAASCTTSAGPRGGQPMKQFMLSWVNHLVYAIVLAMAYAYSKNDD